jgi:hypothetical protein
MCPISRKLGKGAFPLKVRKITSSAPNYAHANNSSRKSRTAFANIAKNVVVDAPKLQLEWTLVVAMVAGDSVKKR